MSIEPKILGSKPQYPRPKDLHDCSIGRIHYSDCPWNHLAAAQADHPRTLAAWEAAQTKPNGEPQEPTPVPQDAYPEPGSFEPEEPTSQSGNGDVKTPDVRTPGEDVNPPLDDTNSYTANGVRYRLDADDTPEAITLHLAETTPARLREKAEALLTERGLPITGLSQAEQKQFRRDFGPRGLPRASQVPPELRPLKQWIGYKKIWDDAKKKDTKPPYSAKTGEKIGAVAKYADHFLTFEEARAGVIKHGLDGLGFVFTESDSYCGIDFDDCVMQQEIDGRTEVIIHDKVREWLRWLPGYAEISVSGTGVHVIGKAKLLKALTAKPLDPPREKPTTEAYAWARFFTFSARRLGLSASVPFSLEDLQRLSDEYQLMEIKDCQIGVDKLLSSLGAQDSGTEPQPTERPMSKLTARKLHEDNLTSLRNAKVGEGNALLNSSSYFAGRCYAAGVFDETAEQIQGELLKITQEWKSPHPEFGARQTIQSGWLTGFAKPLLVKEDEWLDVTKTLEEFNEKYYVVKKIGGKQRVVEEKIDPVMKVLVLELQAVKDFESFYRNDKIQVGEKTKRNDEGQIETVPIMKNRASVWLDHALRRQFDQVYFAPEQNLPENIRNIWRGFKYEPIKGDCGLYLAHLKDNISKKDPAKYKHLIQWMAWKIRNPGKKSYTVIVLKGGEGVGKNVAFKGFAVLFGGHWLIVTRKEHMAGKFNAHLRAALVVGANEAFFAGDKQHESSLKGLATDEEFMLEAKGIDPVFTKNLMSIVIMSNEDWVVPAGPDARRYTVYDCGKDQAENTKYFEAIQRQLDGGGYEALMYHLKYEVDLSDFDPHKSLKTKALSDQKSESLVGTDAAVYECLRRGEISADSTTDGLYLRAERFIKWTVLQNQSKWRGITDEKVGDVLGDNPRTTRRGLGFVRGQMTLFDGARRRGWLVPSLKRCRALWDQRRYLVDWPDKDAEWIVIPVGDEKPVWDPARERR